MTVDELLNALEKDEAYQARRRAQELRIAEMERILTADEADLVAELQGVGLVVSSVWDLVNTTEPYPEGMPVLLRHLEMPHHLRTREGIARALMDPEVRGIGFDVVLRQYLATPRDKEHWELQWILGHCVAQAVHTEDELEIVLELLVDRSLGSTREGLLAVVTYLDRNERRAVLESLVDDPEMGKFAVKRLARWKRKKK